MNPSSLRVTYAQAVHGTEERDAVVRLLDEQRTILGEETKQFEKNVTKKFGKRFGVMVNSGSSANTLAIELLNLPKGSEIITPILTFATTVSPIVRAGLIPVFVEVKEGTYLIDEDKIEKAISEKTRCIMVPLLLGNVPDMKKISRIAKKHGLFVIEDSCDTFAAKIGNEQSSKYSDATTTSFYGSHIITAGGGGGMVMVDKKEDRDFLLMMRGWGRSSSLSGETEDIKKRFSARLDGIEYDTKYLFTALGYNFLPMELSSAFGNAQLRKLGKFKKTREKNVAHHLRFFKKYEKFFILPVQRKDVSTQWLAFPLTIRPDAPFSRKDVVTFLEKNNIQTRPIFTGNILKHPGFSEIPHRKTEKEYKTTELIMRNGFVIGCHQGLETKHLKKIEKVFEEFLKKY